MPESSSRINSEKVPRGKGCFQNSSKSFTGSRKLSPSKVIYPEKRDKAG